MDWLRLDNVTRRWKSPWTLRKTTEALAIGVVFLAGFSIFSDLGNQRHDRVVQSSGCQFPAIFNFGDSNSDTGSLSAMFNRLSLPYGETFFGKPSGRYSDGRLIIDFLAEELGMPYLSAYLDSIGTNFRHGANFAAGGSTIRPAKVYKGDFNPLSLDVQFQQFHQLKARTIELYNEGKNLYIKSSLPRPEDFSKALYTMDSGQNDLHAGLISMTEEEVKASIFQIIDQFALIVEKLYQQGARAFSIHNTGPIGCLPYFVKKYPPKPDNADSYGCVRSFNEVAREFNKQLNDRVLKLRSQLQDALIAYIDIYSAKYTLIGEAEKHGFVNPMGYCCGHHGDDTLECWDEAIVNGSKVYATSCSNPSKYISWDGIHYTESANRWVASLIVNGTFSDLRLPITKACHKPGQSR